MGMMDKLKSNKVIVCIVGLGYVGLPLAEAFSKSLKVIGFDIDKDKISRLNELAKSGKETDLAVSTNLTFASDPKCIGKADFIIIAVPTPVTRSKEPDLSFVENAARIVSQNLKRGSMVILESTVYPGVTEEIVKPILEESGLKCSGDFKLGYSPERINPGDEEHAIDKVAKVVAGMDEETAELLAELYGRICPEIFKAKDIRTAEAAKVIENIQRDLNIALMNELSLIFAKMGLNTKDVLETAGTKWNFHKYSPGLVGGHCIPVDPYYLVYKAKEFGYHPQVILAGRAINDYMAKHVAEMAIKALSDVGKVIRGSRVLIMGLTYKENVVDTRETPVKEMIKTLREYGVEILGCDPLLNDIEQEFGIKAVTDLAQAKNMDCLILAVVHNAFSRLTLDRLAEIMNDKPILIDVRGFFDKKEAEEKGFYYKTL
jgi:UDPglucose 6-dehydrogenase/UDP-N-acetyl-D-galactosamine dehydrogenase